MDAYSEAQVRVEIAAKFNSFASRIEAGRIGNLAEDIETTIDMLQQFSSLSSSDVSDVLELASSALSKVLAMETRNYGVINDNRLNTIQGESGRPYYNIPVNVLQSLLESDFSVSDIARMFKVSVKTIRRRMSAHQLSVLSRYSRVSNQELNCEVRKIVDNFPDVGYRTIASILRSKGHRVQQQRVREALRSVDPQGTLVRRLFLYSHRLQRRTYNVRAPLALWHLDGNHKLIRWRFVIHGCIDGYSRLPVFLKINNDNCAETVLTAFKEAVASYGLPERVRSDKGGENIKVAEYMLSVKGPKSFIAGRSVHNQRIERLWRELWCGVTSFYYNLFHEMEEEGKLDLNDEVHILALHLVYKPWIQNHIDEFRDALSRRPLRTEGNRTPLQLWIRGQILDPKWCPQNEVDNLNYGIDYDGPIPIEEVERVEIPVSPVYSGLDEQAIMQIVQRNSSCFAVDMFQDMVHLLKN